MIVSIIVAMDRRGGIGKDNRLPWRLSADLKRFKELTMGHHIVVGRRTFESIGKPLPGRQTIVVTRNETYQAEGCSTARSVDDALDLARARGETEVFICGGAEVYREAMPRANRMYVTDVHAEVEADTTFPEFDRSKWVERESSDREADETNQYATTFQVFERKPEAG